jgi:hypothetical protein
MSIVLPHMEEITGNMVKIACRIKYSVYNVAVRRQDAPLILMADILFNRSIGGTAGYTK